MSQECEKCSKDNGDEVGSTIKSCISCGKECDIFPVQLGDFATLTYLRLCGIECLFALSYDYLYELYEHKNFRNKLSDLEDPEDRIERQNLQEESLKSFFDDWKPSVDMLSIPFPGLEIFKGECRIEQTGRTCRFKIFIITKEQRLINQLDYIKKLHEKTQIAMEDLEKIKENDEN